MKLTLIGTGLMGYPMAKRLIACGHNLVAYNRTYEKAASLTDFGVEIVTTPQKAIKAAKCIIIMLTDAEAVNEVLFKEPKLLEDRTIIQMSTISPVESMEIRDKVINNGGTYLEAPVLGSISEAQSGTLFVLTGANPEQFAQWLEILKVFGPEPVLVGPVGQAATLKLALNQLISSLTAAFSLSLGMILSNGGNVNIFMDILRKSALYAPTFDKKLPRMLSRDFTNPNFPTRLLAKDNELILETAKMLKIDTSALEGVQEIIRKAIEKGFADTDYSSLFNAVFPE
jgi:3-hydroxyisobutyrate dehydrogenase